VESGKQTFPSLIFNHPQEHRLPAFVASDDFPSGRLGRMFPLLVAGNCRAFNSNRRRCLRLGGRRLGNSNRSAGEEEEHRPELSRTALSFDCQLLRTG